MDSKTGRGQSSRWRNAGLGWKVSHRGHGRAGGWLILVLSPEPRSSRGSSPRCWPVPGRLPLGEGWAVEVKFDGIRLQLRRDGERGLLAFPPGPRLHAEFPELAAIAGALGRHRVLLDGELVCLAADGRPDFAPLRRRLGASRPRARAEAERAPATFIAFDLLHLDGRSTRELPYDRRRELLFELGLDDGSRWRTPRHFVADRRGGDRRDA